jgi:hypothetical protein
MQANAMAGQQKGFDTALNSIARAQGAKGLNRSQLFDTSQQQQGTFDPNGAGFQAAPAPQAQDDSNQSSDTLPAQVVTPPPTHTLIGYIPPKTDPKTGQVTDKGTPGVLMSNDELSSYQDAAAQLAGPQAFRTWQYLRNSPDNAPTQLNGQPWTPSAVDTYNQNAPKYQKAFNAAITQSTTRGTVLPTEGAPGAAVMPSDQSEGGSSGTTGGSEDE